MANKKTNEKSGRRGSLPHLPDNPASSHRAPEPAAMLAAVLLLIGAGLGLFAVAGAAPMAGSNSSINEIPTEYVLAGFTESRMNTVLALGAGKKTLDLKNELAAWKSGRWFSYDEQANGFAPGRASLNATIFPFLGLANPWQAFAENDRVWGFDLDEEKIYAYLSRQLDADQEMAAQSAKLVIAGDRATEFVPDRPGLATDIRSGTAAIKTALFSGQTMADMPQIITQPQIRLGDLNDIGISDLVAQGVSDFTGSSASRIHNIRTGAEKFQGLILKPGEEFSFTTHLGPVTAGAGFLPELVIKAKETVPELGGGLCQVSTTVFRAALYGGLPITARKNHSYAVKYYSPQGTDATIYPGAVDLKFINDTSHHLLISSRIEETKLYFEFYGTPDDRKVAIDGPHSYDIKPDGSMKARLTRTVSLNNTDTSEIFNSRYVSKDLFPTQYSYPKPPAEQTPTGTPGEPVSNPPATPSNEPPQSPTDQPSSQQTPAPTETPAPIPLPIP